jgi:hypothetical protein
MLFVSNAFAFSALYKPLTSILLMQIPPVGGTTIYKTMMTCDHTVHEQEFAAFDPNAAHPNVLMPQAHGIALLKTVKLYRLDAQQRSLCRQHTENIKQLSTNDPSAFPVTDRLLDCYPPISPEEIVQDSLWNNASIGVANNRIRCKIIQQRIIAHAARQRRPVLVWRNPLTGDNAEKLSKAETEFLYANHLQLFSYFAVGVSCSITENLSQYRGIVNGAECIMHSVTLHPDEDSERTRRKAPPLLECIRNAKPGDLVELMMPPLAINVTLTSEKHRAKFTHSDTLVSGQLVIPMLLSSFPKAEKVKPWELLQRRSDPFKTVSYLDHCLEPRYAVTFHKLQVSIVYILLPDALSF